MATQTEDATLVGGQEASMAREGSFLEVLTLAVKALRSPDLHQDNEKTLHILREATQMTRSWMRDNEQELRRHGLAPLESHGSGSVRGLLGILSGLSRSVIGARTRKLECLRKLHGALGCHVGFAEREVRRLQHLLEEKEKRKRKRGKRGGDGEEQEEEGEAGPRHVKGAGKERDDRGNPDTRKTASSKIEAAPQPSAPLETLSFEAERKTHEKAVVKHERSPETIGSGDRHSSDQYGAVGTEPTTPSTVRSGRPSVSKVKDNTRECSSHGTKAPTGPEIERRPAHNSASNKLSEKASNPPNPSLSKSFATVSAFSDRRRADSLKAAPVGEDSTSARTNLWVASLEGLLSEQAPESTPGARHQDHEGNCLASPILNAQISKSFVPKSDRAGGTSPYLQEEVSDQESQKTGLCMPKSAWPEQSKCIGRSQTSSTVTPRTKSQDGNKSATILPVTRPPPLGFADSRKVQPHGKDVSEAGTPEKDGQVHKWHSPRTPVSSYSSHKGTGRKATERGTGSEWSKSASRRPGPPKKCHHRPSQRSGCSSVAWSCELMPDGNGEKKVDLSHQHKRAGGCS